MSSKQNRLLKGVIVPMATPFAKNEDLDLDALRRLTDWLIEQGVHGLFPNSSLGEYPKLSMEERKKVIDVVVDQVNGRVQVIAGTGAVSTRETLELTRHAQDVGADYAIIIEPFYYRPTPEEILDHFKVVADKTDIPLLVYDVPSFTGYSLSADLVARLATIEGIVAIKDSSGDMQKFQKELLLVGDRISVLQGIDQLFLPSLIIGSPGGVLGAGNICASIEVEMYKAFLRGDIELAVRLHNKLFPLWESVSYSTFPAGIKEGMNMMGIFVGPARKPAAPLTEKQREDIRQKLAHLGIL